MSFVAKLMNSHHQMVAELRAAIERMKSGEMTTSSSKGGLMIDTTVESIELLNRWIDTLEKAIVDLSRADTDP